MVSRNEHARVQIFLTSNVKTRMQQQPVSNLFSSVAECKEIQTLLTEQSRTFEKITISFMQNPRLQQTGDTSYWYIRTLQVIWSVSILLWSLIKLTVVDLVRLFFLYCRFIHSLTPSTQTLHELSFVNMLMYSKYPIKLSNNKHLCKSSWTK